MGLTKIAVIGGDRRELYLAEHLAKQGFSVSLSGYEKQEELPGPNFIDPLDAVAGAHAVILPLAGVKENLTPKCPFSDNPPQVAEEFFAALPVRIPVFIGWARQRMKELATSVQLVEVGEDDELAILNSIPTAEGAIAIAMNKTDITIHGSSCLVIGFGRCGFTLARMLQGLGAKVTVAARAAGDAARAHDMGLGFCHIQDLQVGVENMEIIFNTVPGVMILSRQVLRRAGRCSLIVDIASGQGGTDFDSAAEYKINAVHALALPGKVAPLTAGKILTRVYPRFLKQYDVS